MWDGVEGRNFELQKVILEGKVADPCLRGKTNKYD
jgi:hypothetical protein